MLHGLWIRPCWREQGEVAAASWFPEGFTLMLSWEDIPLFCFAWRHWGLPSHVGKQGCSAGLFSCDALSWVRAVWWCHQAGCAENKLFETRDGSFCCLMHWGHCRCHIYCYCCTEDLRWKKSLFSPKLCRFGLLLCLRRSELWLGCMLTLVGFKSLFSAAYPGIMNNVLIESGLLQRETNCLRTWFCICDWYSSTVICD